MYFKNKKAVSEIISFVLITLIVVVSSTLSYLFAKNLIDENLYALDSKNMNIYLKKMYYTTNEISSFDGSSSSFEVSFRTGELRFINNSINYQSLSKYAGSNICLNMICNIGVEGYEVLSTNLSGNYKFSNNINLSPGTYTILFKNIKNESKIAITYK